MKIINDRWLINRLSTTYYSSVRETGRFRKQWIIYQQHNPDLRNWNEDKHDWLDDTGLLFCFAERARKQTYPFLQAFAEKIRTSRLMSQVGKPGLQFSLLCFLWADHLVLCLLKKTKERRKKIFNVRSSRSSCWSVHFLFIL